MNFIQSKDENQLKEVLLHYKKFYLSLGIIIVSTILLFTVIFPQFQQYSGQQNEIQAVEERIGILKQNIQYIAAINEEDQTRNIQTTTQALPGEKDYAGILYAIRTASSKTGVSVGDFTFLVGDVTEKGSGGKSPVITMDLNINGDLKALSLFLSELAKTFPLSSVTQMTINERFSKLSVNFYYKPIPALKVNFANPIKPVSGTNQKLLETLRQWQSERPILDVALPSEASGSATPF